ncbi:MAG: DNA polymerase III subunit delta' [Parcubacteria group bacterium Gr01-1014_44]|nr:MAG: DNA polymerase III subunit delta' [Parcubacteria group bacterium Gr01-1014_44]
MLWQTFGFENIKKYFVPILFPTESELQNRGSSISNIPILKKIEDDEIGKKAIEQDSLEHAYLFSGQEMIGKRTFALELTQYLLWEVSRGKSAIPPTLDPRLVAREFSSRCMADLPTVSTWPLDNFIPNLLLLENQVGIDEIRKLKSFLSLKPYAGRYKIAIIDNAHKMGVEAASAILKVLEEPPAHSLIILVSANPQALLPTIYSRCVEIKFAPHPRTELLKYLSKLGLSGVQAEFLTDFSNGRLGLAYRLKEKDAFKDIKKNLECFNQLLRLGLNDRMKFAEKVLTGDNGSEQAVELLLYWMFYLRSDFSKNLKINRAKVLRNILETRQILSQPQFNQRLALENLLINL